MNKLKQKIGILGGGQLGKMLCQAGSKLGLDISILEADKTYPAFPVCNSWTTGSITSYEDVLEFGRHKDIITIEIENVNIQALEKLEQLGVKVYPPTAALKIIKDKGLQKTFYEGLHFATSDFTLFKDKAGIMSSFEQGKLLLPFVQKSRTDGYDGKGVHIVKTADDLLGLMDTPSVVEDLIDINHEISVIVARRPNGEMTYFPTVEMEFHPTANLVEYLFCPSTIDHHVQEKAIHLAISLAEKLNIVGLLAVEMFITKDNDILINEVAPRPHNSGHHSIEACTYSQYDLHLRAILDLPLVKPELIKPAVMLNLLGEEGNIGPTYYQGLESCLAISGVYPHLYGKSQTKPFRKMGHVTIIQNTLEEAKSIAKTIKSTIKIITNNEL